MKTHEVLARRYCAFLGENPDDIINDLPAWRHALVDLEAAIQALATFGVEARAPMNDDEFITPEDSVLEKTEPVEIEESRETATILPFSCVA